MDIKGYDLPDDLYYHEDHAWALIDSDGNVKVGMNDFFQKAAGDIVYVDLPFEGDEVEQGDVCGKIQSSKWIGKLVSPVSGTILQINEDLESDSALINKDPYGDGWIMLIEPSNLDEEMESLMQGDNVIPWLEKEIQKAEKESSEKK